MRIAGFDLATTSGACVLEGTQVIHVEAYRSRGDDDAQVFHSFRTWLRPLLLAHEVQRVAIEQPLVTNLEMPDKRPGAKPGQTHNPVTMKTYLRLYGLRAHAIEVCAALHIPCIELHQATWRKAFTGNGRATKEESLALARRLVPNLKSKDAAEAIGIAWALNGELNKPKEADLFQEAV